MSPGQDVDAAGPCFQAGREPAQHVGQSDLGAFDLSLPGLTSQMGGHLCDHTNAGRAQWVAQGKGLLALVEVVVFVSILFVGLIYVWSKGDLRWNKALPKGRSLE